MRTTMSKFLASATLVAVLAACVYGATVTKPAADTVPLADAMVRIDLYQDDKLRTKEAFAGHGSGVYIGDEIIITAAHVTKGHAKVIVRSSDGMERPADVLWQNEKYDIAAIRAPAPVTAAHLACVSPKRGDAVVAAGNPLDQDDVYVPGTIVGNERENGIGGKVVLTNAQLAPGMSGGPVYDPAGDVVGINVAVQTADIGGDPFHHDFAMTGINYVVPASVVCDLLGRA
jgi:S1-C subfamily serine protease